MAAWNDSKEKKTRRKKIKNPEIFYTLMPIYLTSKICGLLPVRFSLNKAGKCVGKIDYPQVGYGVFLMLALSGAQCYGLYRDLRDGWQNSTRLSSESSITVTVSDVFAVISVIVIAILGSPNRWRHLQQALDKLVHVDEKLNIATSKNLRKLSIGVVSCTLVYLFVLSVLDYTSWCLLSPSRDNKVYGDKSPINYCPLYFMYLVILSFELQYAVVLFNVGERFLKLNKVFENLTKTNLDIDHLRNDMGLAAQDSRPALPQSISSALGRNNSRIRLFKRVSDEGEGRRNIMCEAIDQLITLHGILCESVIYINKAYGIAILMGTISCLIHLIITPYFLYNHIYSRTPNSWPLLILQSFWILFHIYRLLLFVQPCHMVVVKAKTTGVLVYQASIIDWAPEIKKQLKIFSIQLLQRPIEFTACGLFYLDRGLMTSIAGSVTTYLVILVQFQTADDTKGSKNLLQNASELLKNVSSFKAITSIK